MIAGDVTSNLDKIGERLGEICTGIANAKFNHNSGNFSRACAKLPVRAPRPKFADNRWYFIDNAHWLDWLTTSQAATVFFCSCAK
jgi:hypothetical protein